MFREDLLPIVRPRPSDTGGLAYAEGMEEDGMILAGKVRSPASGEAFEIKNGYLDLLKMRVGADNVANLTIFSGATRRGPNTVRHVHLGRGIV